MLLSLIHIYLMQTGWDQQTVDETKDTGTQRARRNDPLAACMDSVLYRWPDVTKNGRQHQTEEALSLIHI